MISNRFVILVYTGQSNHLGVAGYCPDLTSCYRILRTQGLYGNNDVTVLEKIENNDFRLWPSKQSESLEHLRSSSTNNA